MIDSDEDADRGGFSYSVESYSVESYSRITRSNLVIVASMFMIEHLIEFREIVFWLSVNQKVPDAHKVYKVHTRL